MTHSYATSIRARLGLAVLLAAGGLSVAQAQNLNYAAAGVTNTTTTYSDLGSTGTAIITANTDDANSTTQDIGFTFSYNGASFTQFVLNTNGYLKLGATAPVAPYFYNTPQVTVVGPLDYAGDANLILPFNTDLEAGTSTPEYRVYTSGNAGSRVCTIQWKNVSDKAATISSTSYAKQYANFSFQVKLYEGTGQIEFVYGTATAGATATDAFRTVAVGLRGSSNAYSQLLTMFKASTTAWSGALATNGDYPLPTTTAAPTGHNVRATVLPDAGRTYRFTTATPCPTPAAVVTTFPYTENFDGTASGRLPCGIQILNANNDLATWSVRGLAPNSTPNALIYYYNYYNTTTAADDWTFTPGLSLRAGYTYQLQFKYRVAAAIYPEGLEVKYGMAATVAGQTGLLFSNTNLTNVAYATTTNAQVTTITPTANGIYYIGFHAISAANEAALLIDDIQVTEATVLAVRNAKNEVFAAEASPVPFGETLTLSLTTLKAGPLRLTMSDALGRLVRQTATTVVAGANSVGVPEVANLPAGVYFLTAEQGGATQTIRITHK